MHIRPVLVRRLVPVAALAMAIGALGVSPGSAEAAALHVSFDVESAVDSADIGGHAPPGTKMTVIWMRSSGEVRAREHVVTSAKGTWWFEYRYSFPVDPGDVLLATTPTASRSFTVPAVSISLDRVTNVLRGVAPAGTKVEVKLGDPQNPRLKTIVRVAARGRFRHDFTGQTDITAGDLAVAIWTSPHGDTVTTGAWGQFISVTRGRPFYYVLGTPGQAVSIKLIAPNGKVRASIVTTINLRAIAYGNFTDRDGLPVDVRAGDRIRSSVATDAHVVVPDVRIVADIATSHVSGTCVPNQWYAVDLMPFLDYPGPYFHGGGWWGKADAAGHFDDVVPEGAGLAVGQDMRVTCGMPEGDTVERWSVVQ